VERLAEILAEMVRSALTWEQVNGCPASLDRGDDLTGIRTGYTLLPPEIKTAGEKDDHINASQK
jgi:hypothetical protein